VSVYLLLTYLNISKTIKSLMLAISNGLSVFSEIDLSDINKEEKLRQESLSVIFNSVYLAIKILSLLIPFTIAYALLYFLGETPIDVLGKQVLGTPNLVVLCISSVASYIALRYRVVEKHHVSLESSYSLSHQITHNFAVIPFFAKSMGVIDNIFTPNSMPLEDKPIFIIGLARAGTTALLNALHSKSEFATYTYRFMPFITAPIVANFFNKRSIKKHEVLRERAHGDGHKIGLNSPEAFDEILWKLYYPNIYKNDYIIGVGENQLTDNFVSVFKANLSKVSYLNKKELSFADRNINVRYVSKNNANISRIPALKAIFPKANFVVIFRDPISHARSLHRQHKNFLKIHRNDPFVLKYMNDLGHNEFGLNAKSLLLKKKFSSTFSNDVFEYWLDYWIYVYEYVLKEHSDLVFVSLESLVENERDIMERLLLLIDAEDNSWEDLRVYFKGSNSNTPPCEKNNQQIDYAYSIYNQMCYLACPDLQISG